MASYYESAEPLVFNRIYVGGGLGYSEDDWREVFGTFGPIQEIYIMKTKKGLEQGNVFISFVKTSEACLAVETMNGQQCYNSPRILKVEIAKERSKKDQVEINYDYATDDDFLERIFFSCDRSLNQREVKEYFSEWGTVVKLFLVMDKKTGRSLGKGWARFSKQSEAALALEQADPSYKIDWCDVRRKGNMNRPFGSQNEAGWAPRGSGGNKIKFDEDGNLDYHSLTGITEEDLDYMPGFEPENPNAGPDSLEAITPPGMSREMAKGLFDLAPGLEECRLDTRTGIAKVKYASPKCATFAKEKLDGFSYAGMPIQVKYGKDAEEVAALKETAQNLKAKMDTMLQNGTSDTAGLSAIMESLQLVMDSLKKQGASIDDKPTKDIPWCSAALPPRKPLMGPKTPVVGRLFFVATPESFYDKILVNVFCRFGDLIRVGFEKDKRFGFAHFGSQEAADVAKRTMHGHYIFSSKMKVEYASVPKVSDGRPEQSKRTRME